MKTKQKTFNVGDKVVFFDMLSESILPEITTVSKITPTGRIRIENHPDYQFDSNGNLMSKSRQCRSSIVLLTPELNVLYSTLVKIKRRQQYENY